MGLLGNVLEVKDLRPTVMTPEFIAVFSDLLNLYGDGIQTLFFRRQKTWVEYLLDSIALTKRPGPTSEGSPEMSHSDSMRNQKKIWTSS